MNYKRLEKCFHDPRIQYEREYISRFQSKDAMHLPLWIGQYRAFCLNAEEMTDLTDQLQQENMKIESVAAKLSAHGGLEKYLFDCVFGEIIASNAIELIDCSHKDLMSAEKAVDGNQPHVRFAPQFKQYKALLENPLRAPQCARDIRKIYDALLGSDMRMDDPFSLPDGTMFRAGEVCLDTCQADVHHGTVSEQRIIHVIDAALHNLADTEPALKAALFHFVFEYLHPFYDGNGRTGRFISALHLREKYHPAGVLHLSQKLNEHRSQYYKMFRLCEKRLNRADLTPFVLFFLDQFLEGMRGSRKELEKRALEFERLQPA